MALAGIEPRLEDIRTFDFVWIFSHFRVYVLRIVDFKWGNVAMLTLRCISSTWYVHFWRCTRLIPHCVRERLHIDCWQSIFLMIRLYGLGWLDWIIRAIEVRFMYSRIPIVCNVSWLPPPDVSLSDASTVVPFLIFIPTCRRAPSGRRPHSPLTPLLLRSHHQKGFVMHTASILADETRSKLLLYYLEPLSAYALFGGIISLYMLSL